MGIAKRGPNRLSSAELRARNSPLWKQREKEEREAAQPVDPKDRFFAHGNGETPKAKPRKRAKQGSVDSPEWLVGDAEKMWAGLGQQLIDSEVLDLKRDEIAFGMMCRCASDYEAALRIIDAEGLTCKSVTGAIYQHPAVGIANKAREGFLKIAKQFGLVGPASRA